MRTYVIRGLLAIIPLALSFFAVKILYTAVDKRVTGVMEGIVGFTLPGFGILVVLVTLYVLGLIASNVVGKQIFGLVEGIVNRVPLIKTTYRIGKQLTVNLSLPEQQVFKRAVLVEYLKPGILTVGFVTGTIIDRKENDAKLLKAFVPTPPNPTSGTMVVVKESLTRDPGWTIEEALKAVISGGIIGPMEFR